MFFGYYRWWPPPWFTLLLVIFNVSIYIYHIVILSQSGEAITWYGPAPLCSVLIFNPDVRYQVLI